jgi:beta-1,4-mannosyltransferase
MSYLQMSAPWFNDPSSPGNATWTIILIASIAIIGPLLLVPAFFINHLSTRPHRRKTVIVMVLGDIGRSPRMMYHASSLARHGWHTTLVGYTDTPPITSLLESPHVHIRGLTNPPKLMMSLPWIARAPIRIIYQVVSVLKICLFDIPFHVEVLLVQNPPSIPTLVLAQIVAWAAGAKLIIDWHNTGYSILAMRTGDQSRLVRIARWFERTYGQKAYAHLFVTQALQKFLIEEWSLQ